MKARRTAAPPSELGRLSARPAGAVAGVGPGLHALGVSPIRDALLYVPAELRSDRPAPLAVMLHGAGGGAEAAIDLLRSGADRAGVILLAPPSRAETWDVIMGGYGPDVEFVDRALAAAFSHCPVDSRRLAIGGFSDGASYALSIGLTNGDLFSHVLAFSPGFCAPGQLVGTPSCFLSHGTGDPVLPIDRCSRVIVPRLRRAGRDVLYREFDGGHSVPPAVAAEALEWFTTPR